MCSQGAREHQKERNKLELFRAVRSTVTAEMILKSQVLSGNVFASQETYKL